MNGLSIVAFTAPAESSAEVRGQLAFAMWRQQGWVCDGLALLKVYAAAGAAALEQFTAQSGHVDALQMQMQQLIDLARAWGMR